MLSNSNVFTLLILIEYVTLFDYTLANSVLVNARTADQTIITPNDTEITNYTLEAVATTLSSASSIILGDQQNNTQTTKASKPQTQSQPIATTSTIKLITSTELTRINPLVPENHKLFEKNGQSINATNVNITSSSSLPLSSLSSIQTIQSSIDQTINPDEIPLLHDINTENVHNTKDKSNLQQTPIHEMVSSTLASEKKISHYLVDTLSKSKITIANKKNEKIGISGRNVENRENDNDDDDDCDGSHGCDEINTNATNRSPPNENGTNNNANSTVQVEDNKETNNNKMHNINSIDYDDDNNMNMNTVNDHNRDYHHHIAQADAPITNYDTMNQLPEPTIRSDAVYFVVAVIGGAKIWSRTLLRTLSDMGPPFSGDPLGSPLVPIFIDLPTNGRFSVNVLLSLCQQTEKRPLAGVVVIGNGQSAHAVALSGTSMNLPVLWAKGGTTALRELHPEASLQALLQPSAIEIFEAIRALFLQTHWHSFFVLSNVQATNVMNAKDNPLKKAPLTPTVVPLPRNNDDVFKQLAQISRSTRGVILLLCNLQSTRRIMSEAQRLNMVGGHFIWLWIDTSISSVYFDSASSTSSQQPIYRYQSSTQSQPLPTRKTTIVNAESTWKKSDSVEHQKSAKPTLDRSSRFDENDDIKSESMHFEEKKFISSEISSQAKGIDIDKHKGETIIKPSGDFSHGFDPFRVLQRQDDHLKTGFGLGQHYQDRNVTRDKQASVNRLILGLRSENNSPLPPTDDQIQNIANKKNRRSTTDHIDNTDDKYFDSNEMMTDDFGKIDLNLNVNANPNQDSNEDDELAKFYYFNQTASKKFNRTTSTAKQHYNDDNLFDYLIDSNNLNESRNSKLNFKRTSMTNNGNHMNTSMSSSSLSSTSFVNYHQFKDFPIGLLALRPIRMNIDRHFIRATIRVFAATWRKINIESKLNNTGQTNLNGTIERPMSSIARSQQSLRGQQDKGRNRNAHISAPLFTAKKLDTEFYNRIMRRKRNISTVNRLLLVTLNKRSIKLLNGTSELNSERNTFDDADLVENKETVPTHSMQVNNSSVLKGFNRTSSANNYNNNNNNNKNNTNNNNNNSYMNIGDNNNDESIKLDYFSSDLPNKNKTYNKNLSNRSGSSSFNQNFSGLLWKQNSNNKSNIQPFNITSSHIIKNQLYNNQSDQTEIMAKEASQTVLQNWFNAKEVDDIRMPSNKRQSTWWSTKKEIPSSNVQNRRPAVDASDHRDAIHLKLHSTIESFKKETPHYSGGCYGNANEDDIRNAEYFSRALRNDVKMALSGKPIYNGFSERALTTNFELFNLVSSDHPYPSKASVHQHSHRQKRGTRNTKGTSNENGPTKWRRVGLVSASNVRLDTIVWPGGDIVVSGLSARARSVFRIVTALAPPFVMESELDEDGLCLRGLPCHRLSSVGRHNLTLMFNAIETRDRLEEDAVEHGSDLPPEPEYLDEKISHVTKCCYGLTMDLLDNIAMELGFEFHLYIVRDQLFGAKQHRNIKDFLKNDNRPHQQKNPDKVGSNRNANKADHAAENEQWNGIIGDLTGGLADMSFAPLSVSKARAQVIDFSIPYFHSGVSLLASPKTKSEIPLLAFLLPFSPELWIAIFTSLNITAVAVAVYEWLSPFGLNPWGRQRSKNFSLSSALWVMWGLLCGHLVAFKAPKSWPNKFLINVWGGFSVIFVASYTANIAALIAGLFFHHAASSYDSSLATQRVGAPIASAAESYVQNKDRHLWEHMKKYSINHIEDGIRGLKNGTLDLLMADSPILDYYRATDHGCSLQRIGETFVEDTYAIGMVKGFPLKESISALIAKYSSNGYLDILTQKWYGGLPCFKYEAEMVTPRPLGVAAVAGVFLLLGMGMLMGVIILVFEHWFYKYALPSLRLKPKGTIWKSRNIMFFSQKLYRFINCVELVSPHHAARELVHSIRQGQIASLFQKSIKREDEQRRRRKSKAQFFEMIQEIRRAQQVERQNLAAVAEAESQKENLKSPPSIFKPKASPKTGIFSALKKEGRSRSNSSVLTVRRYSTDSILGDRMDSIGGRLSRDLTNSPPDLGRRYESYGKNDNSPNRYETITGGKFPSIGISKSNETLTNRYDTFSGKNSEKANIPVKANKKGADGKRPKISFESYDRDELSGPQLNKEDFDYELPSVKDGLEPKILQDDRSSAILRHKLHQEIRDKYLTLPDTSNNASAPLKLANAIDVKPPLPKKVVKHQRQKSLDNLDVDKSASNKSKTSPTFVGCDTGSLTKMNKQTSKMSLERLSREDLLRLSHSSQSEIHEYLKNSTMPDRSADPP